jgi:hypothetical protein
MLTRIEIILQHRSPLIKITRRHVRLKGYSPPSKITPRVRHFRLICIFVNVIEMTDPMLVTVTRVNGVRRHRVINVSAPLQDTHKRYDTR